ncbi:hypothetical protein J6590_038452 [Homalodisca vitripennis]|nr:hypothetical protein J6590_038452 [Homalodisca vitripennis]
MLPASLYSLLSGSPLNTSALVYYNIHVAFFSAVTNIESAGRPTADRCREDVRGGKWLLFHYDQIA